jgi:membrane peptidoglycan carboxypeptidase
VGFTPRLVTGVWNGFDKPRTIISNGFAGEIAVTMWARFMKQATADDEPEPFKSPKGLAAVNVCRQSGRLPGAFCDRVITEYFARGTAPVDVCQEHNFSLAAQLASSLPAGSIRSNESLPQPAPPPPPVPVATASAPAQRDAEVAMATQAEEEPKKKRGFWSRLFGRGGDDGEDKKDDDDKKREERKNGKKAND